MRNQLLLLHHKRPGYHYLFENNRAVQKNSDTQGVYGGAIAIGSSWNGEINPYVVILNSRFTKNKVDHEGGNVNTHGGAVYSASPLIMANTLIDSNSAEFSGAGGRGMGGGMMVRLDSKWDQNGNEIKGYIYLVNNTIVNNYASASGNDRGEAGGIHNRVVYQIDIAFNLIPVLIPFRIQSNHHTATHAASTGATKLSRIAIDQSIRHN
jgi:hypothetical protein